MPWSNEQDALKQDAKLERTDNGVIETAQTGVEYISPQQHGGIYGTVYRQYYSGTTGTLGNAAFPATSGYLIDGTTAMLKVIESYFAVEYATDKYYLEGFVFNSTLWLGRVWEGGSGPTINYGSGLDAKPYIAWIDYTK